MKPLPNTVIGLIEEMESNFPPACKVADESLEDHARYAGKVELITNLRNRFEVNLRREKNKLPDIL